MVKIIWYIVAINAESFWERVNLPQNIGEIGKEGQPTFHLPIPTLPFLSLFIQRTSFHHRKLGKNWQRLDGNLAIDAEGEDSVTSEPFVVPIGAFFEMDVWMRLANRLCLFRFKKSWNYFVWRHLYESSKNPFIGGSCSLPNLAFLRRASCSQRFKPGGYCITQFLCKSWNCNSLRSKKTSFSVRLQLFSTRTILWQWKSRQSKF